MLQQGNYKIDANYVDGDFDGGFYNPVYLLNDKSLKD